MTDEKPIIKATTPNSKNTIPKLIFIQMIQEKNMNLFILQ